MVAFGMAVNARKEEFRRQTRNIGKNKIERNKLRDKEVSRFLRNNGYTVIRIRECQLKKNPNRQLSRIINTINK